MELVDWKLAWKVWGMGVVIDDGGDDSESFLHKKLTPEKTLLTNLHHITLW